MIKITREADKLLKLFVEYTLRNKTINTKTIDRHINKYRLGEYHAIMNYLKDSNFIDFVWCFSTFEDKFQPFIFKSVTPMGILRYEMLYMRQK